MDHTSLRRYCAFPGNIVSLRCSKKNSQDPWKAIAALYGSVPLHTVSAKKNAHFFKLVTELCQFLGGSWKVITNIQQLSQLLSTVNNRGSGLLLLKKTSQLKWKGPQKGKKKRFFEKSENLWLWTNQCNWRADKRGEYADLVQD